MTQLSETEKQAWVDIGRVCQTCLISDLRKAAVWSDIHNIDSPDGTPMFGGNFGKRPISTHRALGPYQALKGSICYMVTHGSFDGRRLGGNSVVSVLFAFLAVLLDQFRFHSGTKREPKPALKNRKGTEMAAKSPNSHLIFWH